MGKHRMRSIQGRPISPGYAIGWAVLYDIDRPAVPRYSIASTAVKDELQRFHRSLEHSRADLKQLQDRVALEHGCKEAEIFSAHLAFLTDQQFIERVNDHVDRELVNAEQAIETVVSELADTLKDLDNEYLREREQDVRDVGRRVLRNLARHDISPARHLPPQSVLVTHELLPSDMLEFDRTNLVGIVLETGSDTSHGAILARSWGVAAVTGVLGATRWIESETRLLVDGQTGEVVIDPAPEAMARVAKRKRRYDHDSSIALAAESRKCVTQDGVQISLYANIGRPDESAEVSVHHLDGVGLFRTEYMFLEQPEPPSFERQLDGYRDAAERLQARPLIIRTLDLGGDKQPSFLATRFEANPKLGVRGLRSSLTVATDLFRTQLRAMLHASTTHDIRVLFPMVLGSGDFQQGIAVLREVARMEGIGRIPPVGALIETPSAVFTLNEILARADFLSIGTNDLTQFMLAADRNALALMDDYSVLHPAVLRAIQTVVVAADARQRPVSVCGEAAGNPLIACLLVGLGVRILSMNAVSAARVRYTLRDAYGRKLEQLAAAHEEVILSLFLPWMTGLSSHLANPIAALKRFTRGQVRRILLHPRAPAPALFTGNRGACDRVTHGLDEWLKPPPGGRRSCHANHHRDAYGSGMYGQRVCL